MVYDVIGNIAIFKPGTGSIKKAKQILKQNKNITTVVEKVEKVKGRLRTIKTKYLAGIKTKEALYRENSCVFKLNIETCYFSPRLAEQRKQVSEIIKKSKKKNILIMFAGVAPYSIVIAKKNPKTRVFSIELGRECCKYAKENVELNKLDNIEIIQGDVKKVIPKFKKKFDFIVMPRPQLTDSFLKQAFKVSRKNTRIFYYDFYEAENKNKLIEKIKKEAEENNIKIRVLKTQKSGEIGVNFFRYRVDIKVI